MEPNKEDVKKTYTNEDLVEVQYVSTHIEQRKVCPNCRYHSQVNRALFNSCKEVFIHLQGLRQNGQCECYSQAHGWRLDPANSRTEVRTIITKAKNGMRK